MKELILSNNREFIGAWFLKDLSVCDRLMEYYESKEDKAKPGIIGADSIVNENLKKCKELFISPLDPSIREYINALYDVCEQYKKRYKYCKTIGEWGIEHHIKLQKYLPDEAYYAWHTERDCARRPFVTRHLVFLTYLNDVNDAGETEFFYQELKVKPQKGLTLIWPADWTHTHRGVPSPSEVKYIATGWYNFI